MKLTEQQQNEQEEQQQMKRQEQQQQIKAIGTTTYKVSRNNYN